MAGRHRSSGGTAGRAGRRDPAPRADAGGSPGPDEGGSPGPDGNRTPARRTTVLTVAAVAVAVVAIVAVIGALATRGSDDGRTTAGQLTNRGRSTTAPGTTLPTATGSTTAASPSPSASTTRRPPTKQAAPRPPAPPMATLVVRAARGGSWLRVRNAAGRYIYDDLVPQGQSRTFQDGRRLDVVLGNAAALDVTVNGRPGPRGSPGAVVRFSIAAVRR